MDVGFGGREVVDVEVVEVEEFMEDMEDEEEIGPNYTVALSL